MRYELSRRWHIRLVRNMVENLFCKKIGKINNGKPPKNVALGRRRTRDATSPSAFVLKLRLFASRAMAAAKTISIDVVSDIV